MFKHDNSVLWRRKRVKDCVTHQNIGGEIIILEFGITCEEVLFLAATEGNPACSNFINRRDDFDCDFNKSLFYGKVGGLGYVVAEDELEEIA